jgi:hypothetical protein
MNTSSLMIATAQIEQRLHPPLKPSQLDFAPGLSPDIFQTVATQQSEW